MPRCLPCRTTGSSAAPAWTAWRWPNAGAERWPEIAARLRAEDTGIIFNAAPFIYNFFEFDKLPWQKKALRELVAWRLQKDIPRKHRSL